MRLTLWQKMMILLSLPVQLPEIYSRILMLTWRRKRTEQVAKIGENIQISRSQSLSPESNGLVESYVHTGGKVAVLVSIGSDSADVSSSEQVATLAKDICMHIAATSPVCVSREEVPADLVQKEKEIAQAQAEGKPPQAIENSD